MQTDKEDAGLKSGQKEKWKKENEMTKNLMKVSEEPSVGNKAVPIYNEDDLVHAGPDCYCRLRRVERLVEENAQMNQSLARDLSAVVFTCRFLGEDINERFDRMERLLTERLETGAMRLQVPRDDLEERSSSDSGTFKSVTMKSRNESSPHAISPKRQRKKKKPDRKIHPRDQSRDSGDERNDKDGS